MGASTLYHAGMRWLLSWTGVVNSKSKLWIIYWLETEQEWNFQLLPKVCS